MNGSHFEPKRPLLFHLRMGQDRILGAHFPLILIPGSYESNLEDRMIKKGLVIGTL